MPPLCDVPGCPEEGSELGSLGRLCGPHFGRFQEDLKRDAVFTAEPFLDATTAEDEQRAREECYSRWLGKVTGATAP